MLCRCPVFDSSCLQSRPISGDKMFHNLLIFEIVVEKNFTKKGKTTYLICKTGDALIDFFEPVHHLNQFHTLNLDDIEHEIFQISSYSVEGP